MQTFHTIAELRDALDGVRAAGQTIGLVPTMGNLHEGHLALVAAARAQNDVTVASIFVNPLQFGPNEDFSSYPRTLEADSQALETAGTDLIFAPSDAEMYPDGRAQQTQVLVPELTTILCGESRPGHFDGVATVVTKLFNAVQPHTAFFGQKDFQQLTLIKTMVRHLNVPVTVVGVPTVRAADGLALSSRNQYLTEEERAIAPALYRTLANVVASLEKGDRDVGALEDDAAETIAASGMKPDYIAIRCASTLGPVDADTTDARVFGAAYCGRARLIDNLPATLS